MIEAGAIYKDKYNEKIVVVTCVEEEDDVLVIHTINEEMKVERLACMKNGADETLTCFKTLEFVKQSEPSSAVKALFGCGETVLKEI